MKSWPTDRATVTKAAHSTILAGGSAVWASSTTRKRAAPWRDRSSFLKGEAPMPYLFGAIIPDIIYHRARLYSPNGNILFESNYPDQPTAYRWIMQEAALR